MTIEAKARSTCCNGFGSGQVVWTKPSELWYNLKDLEEDQACWIWEDAIGIADGAQTRVDVPVHRCPYCGVKLPENGPVS